VCAVNGGREVDVMRRALSDFARTDIPLVSDVSRQKDVGRAESRSGGRSKGVRFLRLGEMEVFCFEVRRTNM